MEGQFDWSDLKELEYHVLEYWYAMLDLLILTIVIAVMLMLLYYVEEGEKELLIYHSYELTTLCY